MPQKHSSSDLLNPSSAIEDSNESRSSQFRLQERSPHPYRRRKETPTPQINKSYLPSPTLTPYHSDAEDGVSKHGGYTRSRLALSRTPSESGSEVDGEGLGFVKALPPTSPKLHKGLKTGEDEGIDVPTPLISPQPYYDGREQVSEGYFEPKSEVLVKRADSEIQKKISRHRRRRNAEVLRRTSEVAVLVLVGCAVLSNPVVRNAALDSHRELAAYLRIFLGLCLVYVVRLILPLIDFSSWKSIRLRPIRIPSAFDPAPLLYPVVLPVLVSLSLVSWFPPALMPNIILSLVALPPQLLSSFDGRNYQKNLHWLLTLMPLIMAEWTQWPFDAQLHGFLRITHLVDSDYIDWLFYTEPKVPYFLKALNMGGLLREDLALLYPLQQALLLPLHYLTTTSLLPAELQLLATCMINILLLSRSPQAIILGAVIWIGGLGLFILCGHVLCWNVALERIPRWRFQRAARAVRAGRTFISTLVDGLNAQQEVSSSHAIQDDDDISKHDFANGESHAKMNGAISRSKSSDPPSVRAYIQAKSGNDLPNGTLSKAYEDTNSGAQDLSLKRRRTVASSHEQPHRASDLSKSQRKPFRSMSSSVQAYLAMTARQATVRKWLYAIYTYFVSLGLIFLPIRIYVQHNALSGQEPIGWAIGYLFSDLPFMHETLEALNLTSWIPKPEVHSPKSPKPVRFYGLLDYAPPVMLSPANTRLVLFTYWFVVVSLGIASVIHLSTLVEVDTRRKVFHGMMVAMLLPTTFVDPAFLSLGLAIVLAVFLLLDLFRAAQLRPLSKPLAHFLTPYVDGRDLRGPVVISHMFLLIGCAIPLWLSLAGTRRRAAPPPWSGWDLATRDVSMVAGVVCVGMGDAAASLIGRRYGRRKWPWLGGKSLEGSAAFAGAVTVGLMFAKAWLVAGQWDDAAAIAAASTTGDGARDAWAVTLGKAALAAAGASFTEAVLTGANDNVVVPIVLWLLVRGLLL